MGNLFCCEPEYCSSDDEFCYSQPESCDARTNKWLCETNNDCRQSCDNKYVYANQQSQYYPKFSNQKPTDYSYQYYPSYQSPQIVTPTAPPYEDSKK